MIFALRFYWILFFRHAEDDQKHADSSPEQPNPDNQNSSIQEDEISRDNISEIFPPEGRRSSSSSSDEAVRSENESSDQHSLSVVSVVPRDQEVKGLNEDKDGIENQEESKEIAGEFQHHWWKENMYR